MAKRYKGNIDFRQKETVRQVVLLWNKLNKKQKNELNTTQLQRVIDVARENNRPDIFKQVYPIFNRKRSANISDVQKKRVATRKLNAISKAELVEMQEDYAYIKKIQRIQKATGVVVAGNQASRLGIPSADIFKISKELYVQQRVEANLEATEDRQLKTSTVIKKAEKEYDEARKMAKNISLREINKESLNFASQFIETYFRYGDPENNDKIKAYLELLNTQERYAVLQTITSEKFKKQYDSDPRNSGYNPNIDEGERARLRQEHLLKILKNETKKSVTIRKGRPVIKELKRRKQDLENTFQNWM